MTMRSPIVPYTNVAAMAPAPSSSPTLPAFSNIALCAGLWNFNPVGWPSGPSMAINDEYSPSFTGVSPYPIDYATFIMGDPGFPALADGWYDQNNVNGLLGTGTARPTFQITSSVTVTGTGAGVYTYRGQSGGYAYYNLTGQSDSTVNYAIVDNGSNTYKVTGAAGALLNTATSSLDVFPWLSTWTGSTVTMTAPGAGEVQFDGVNDYLQSNGAVTLGQTATFYCYFKTTDLASTDALIQLGISPLDTVGGVSVRMVAGVLTVQVTDDTETHHNTKVKTISDSNWHLLGVTIDTTASAAHQVTCYLDGSTSGWTAPESADLTSISLSEGDLYVGSIEGAVAFFTGSMKVIRVQTDADNATKQAAMYAWINSIDV